MLHRDRVAKVRIDRDRLAGEVDEVVASMTARALRPEQVAGNAKAASWERSGEEVEAIDAMTIRSQQRPAGCETGPRAFNDGTSRSVVRRKQVP